MKGIILLLLSEYLLINLSLLLKLTFKETEHNVKACRSLGGKAEFDKSYGVWFREAVVWAAQRYLMP